MKKILCYGDSNTYGFIPRTAARYDKDSRWSGILESALDYQYEIIEEGMNNRTGFFTNPEGLKQSGGEYLSIYLQNHQDIDICILALGTNDAQIFYNLTSENCKLGLENLITSVKKVNKNTKIIIVPPVKITQNILKSYFSLMFNQTSISKIQEVFPIFEQTASSNNCLYCDFNQFAPPSDTDGLHYTKSSHEIIAQKLSELILEVNK
ncbi:MAG: GDSL-type esterase/lipase family protein [Muribaculaceae bacterium]|nr:GDSL-type esterase/lipase family protein [Muribaculaceae bacterium]